MSQGHVICSPAIPTPSHSPDSLCSHHPGCADLVLLDCTIHTHLDLCAHTTQGVQTWYRMLAQSTPSHPPGSVCSRSLGRALPGPWQDQAAGLSTLPPAIVRMILDERWSSHRQDSQKLFSSTAAHILSSLFRTKSTHTHLQPFRTSCHNLTALVTSALRANTSANRSSSLNMSMVRFSLAALTSRTPSNACHEVCVHMHHLKTNSWTIVGKHACNLVGNSL